LNTQYTINTIKPKILALSPLMISVFVVLAIIPIVYKDFYLIELLKLALVYCIFAISWDVLSGYTEQMNFGHAFFIGGAGYIGALLNLHFGMSPVLTIPISGSLAALTGIGIGYLTLRLKGPYFALATIAFQSVLFKLSFIVWRVSGGEEGLVGIDTLTDSVIGDFYVTLAITAFCFIVLSHFVNSKYGVILKSTRFNEEAAEASGINTTYYKIAAFVLCGFFAGVGGALYSHTNMQIGPHMLGGYLCVLIVLMSIVGGMGTLVGPFISALVLSIFNEWLRIIEVYRIAVFTGILILLIYLNPSGFTNSEFLKKSKLLSWFFFERRR
jgi:branched-chain amino acid transport system permease protein